MNVLHRSTERRHVLKPASLRGRAIRCFLFDLGDTLWSRGDKATWEQHERTANHRAVTLLRERIDPALLPLFDDLALGQQLRQMIDRHIRLRIRRDPEIEPDGTLAVIETLEQWGIPRIDHEFGAAIFEALRIRISESRPLYADTHPTLAELQRRGFLLGVVSNRIWGGQPLQEDLRALGLHRYFESSAMAVSSDLGVRKPNPAMFLHALNAMQASPQEAVMVGDSLSADVLGAQALGIFAIWKPKPELFKRIQSQAHMFQESGEEPLAGMHVTDDDFMLAQDRSRDYLDRYLRGEIQPELIIEHLSDLLEIFQEAGVQ
jgi:HAD superfamily hydrolase (TIGR01549 family)